jgi:hypothetical protein
MGIRTRGLDIEAGAAKSARVERDMAGAPLVQLSGWPCWCSIAVHHCFSQDKPPPCARAPRARLRVAASCSAADARDTTAAGHWEAIIEPIDFRIGISAVARAIGVADRIVDRQRRLNVARWPNPSRRRTRQSPRSAALTCGVLAPRRSDRGQREKCHHPRRKRSRPRGGLGLRPGPALWGRAGPDIQPRSISPPDLSLIGVAVRRRDPGVEVVADERLRHPPES